MTNSSLRSTSFFIVTLAACAQDPALDPAPVSRDEAPPGLPPREETPPIVSPPVDNAPSVGPSHTAAPWVLHARSRVAPAVVSGSAWISPIRELHAHVSFDRTDADVRWLHARLLASDGTEIAVPPPVAVEAPARTRRWAAEVRVAANVVNATVYAIELTLEDANGARSRAFPLLVAESRGLRDGEACTSTLGIDACDVGSFCGPSRVCAVPSAPVMLRAEAYRDTAARSAVRLTWYDSNGDVDALEVSLGRRCPRVTVLPLAERSSPAVRDAEFRWPTDIFEGETWATVRVRDRSGRLSEPTEVSVRAPATLVGGSACEPESVAARCAEGAVCTRYADASCNVPRCQTDVRTCPAGFEVVTLSDTPASDGTWRHAETRSLTTWVRPSNCDRDIQGGRAYRFQAPAAGTWRVVARGDSGWATLTARTRCTIGDVDAVSSSSSSATGASVELTLREPQDVYIFPSAGSRTGVPIYLEVSRVR